MRSTTPSLHKVLTGFGANRSPIKWVLGSLCQVGERSGCKDDHSPPSVLMLRITGDNLPVITWWKHGMWMLQTNFAIAGLRNVVFYA